MAINSARFNYGYLSGKISVGAGSARGKFFSHPVFFSINANFGQSPYTAAKGIETYIRIVELDEKLEHLE